MTIYFVQPENGGPIKIGFTTKPLKSKLNQLRHACPYPLIVLAKMAGSAPQERKLHRRFAEHRLRGEWFHPAAPLLDFIANLQRRVKA